MPDRTLHFVTSTAPHARLAHLGGGPHTGCGMYLFRHRVSADMPTDRTLCRRCAALAVTAGTLAAVEADVLLAHVPYPGAYDRLVILLREERDEMIARQLGISTRTLTRRVRVAMRAAGARTRFDFGYLAALEETGRA